MLCAHHVQPSVAPWAVPCQAPLSMEFSRKDYWCGLPLPTAGDLPDPGIEPTSLVSPAVGFLTCDLENRRAHLKMVLSWVISTAPRLLTSL